MYKCNVLNQTYHWQAQIIMWWWKKLKTIGALSSKNITGGIIAFRALRFEDLKQSIFSTPKGAPCPQNYKRVVQQTAHLQSLVYIRMIKAKYHQYQKCYPAIFLEDCNCIIYPQKWLISHLMGFQLYKQCIGCLFVCLGRCQINWIIIIGQTTHRLSSVPVRVWNIHTKQNTSEYKSRGCWNKYGVSNWDWV